MSRRSFQYFTESFPNGKAIKILKGCNGWNSSFVERKCRKLLPRYSRGGVFVLCLEQFTSFSHLFLCLNFALKVFFASCDFGGGGGGGGWEVLGAPPSCIIPKPNMLRPPKLHRMMYLSSSTSGYNLVDTMT